MVTSLTPLARPARLGSAGSLLGGVPHPHLDAGSWARLPGLLDLEHHFSARRSTAPDLPTPHGLLGRCAAGFRIATKIPACLRVGSAAEEAAQPARLLFGVCVSVPSCETTHVLVRRWRTPTVSVAGRRLRVLIGSACQRAFPPGLARAPISDLESYPYRIGTVHMCRDAAYADAGVRSGALP